MVVFSYFFGQGPTFAALQRSFAKSVDNTGVQDVWYKSFPYTAHIHAHIKHFLFQLSSLLSGYPASSFANTDSRFGRTYLHYSPLS